MQMFELMDILFPIFFLLILGIIIFSIINRVLTWNKNNHSPRLTVPAKVIAKRANTNQHMQGNAGDITGAHGYTTTTSTSYYATFQFESGDRMEFLISGREYGLLAEGDEGKLTFQGTRYLSFERQN